MADHPMVEFEFFAEHVKQKPCLTHNRIVIGTVGHIALDLIRALNVTCLVPDGETSDGGQKSRLFTPQEAVARAFEIAELTLAELDKRQWLVHLPPLAQVVDTNGRSMGFNSSDD